MGGWYRGVLLGLFELLVVGGWSEDLATEGHHRVFSLALFFHLSIGPLVESSIVTISHAFIVIS